MAIERKDGDFTAKAALFDLDGVLARTDRLHFAAWKSLCDSQGWRFNERINDLLRGVPRMESLRVILNRNGVELSDKEAAPLAERKNELFKEALKSISKRELVPGSLELVGKLRALGIKTAVCSSSRNAGEIVDRLSMRRLFDVVVYGADVVKAKPDPEIFLTAAKLLGVPPESCLVIEDAQSGIDAANAAGMRAIAFGQCELKGAWLKLESFAGLSPETLLAPDGATR